MQGVGFVIAGRLALGNSIVTRAGPSVTLAKIEWKQGKPPYVVYNFGAKEHHAFFVWSANSSPNTKRIQASLECVSLELAQLPETLNLQFGFAHSVRMGVHIVDDGDAVGNIEFKHLRFAHAVELHHDRSKAISMR